MKASQSCALMSDFEVFTNRRKRWLQKHQGKFVVLHKNKVIGFFDDYVTGLRAGISAFGVNSQFLVQQVYEEEPIFVI
jgi:hypothetical protein